MMKDNISGYLISLPLSENCREKKHTHSISIMTITMDTLGTFHKSNANLFMYAAVLCDKRQTIIN